MRHVLESAVRGDGSGLRATSGLLVGGQEGALDVYHTLHVLTNDVRMSRLKARSMQATYTTLCVATEEGRCETAVGVGMGRRL